jgi:hypothetical protein
MMMWALRAEPVDGGELERSDKSVVPWDKSPPYNSPRRRRGSCPADNPALRPQGSQDDPVVFSALALGSMQRSKLF